MKTLRLALFHLSHSKGLLLRKPTCLTLPEFASYEKIMREPQEISRGLSAIFPELHIFPEEIEPLTPLLANPFNVYIATIEGPYIPNAADALWLPRRVFQEGRFEGLPIDSIASQSFLSLNQYQYGFA
jgi:hypothetical protein